jgi:hypothetical protein
VPVDVDDVFRRGGADLVDFLQFCVLSVQLEPVFALLVREYRAAPTVARALALYDLFCAPGAPARIRAEAALPPHDPRLPRALLPLRQPPVPPPAEAAAEGRATTVPAGPAKYLFDAVVAHLRQGDDRRVGAVGQQFDPGHTPLENLPGGRMTAGQRAFLENVWRPRVRPALVAAGFWRVATIGG